MDRKLSWIDPRRVHELARDTGWTAESIGTHLPAVEPVSVAPSPSRRLTHVLRGRRPGLPQSATPPPTPDNRRSRFDRLLEWALRTSTLSHGAIVMGDGQPLAASDADGFPAALAQDVNGFIQGIDRTYGVCTSGHAVLHIGSRVVVVTWQDDGAATIFLVLAGSIAPPGEILLELALALTDTLRGDELVL